VIHQKVEKPNSPRPESSLTTTEEWQVVG